MFLLETAIQTPEYFDVDRAQKELDVIQGVAHVLHNPLTAIHLYNSRRDLAQSSLHMPVAIVDDLVEFGKKQCGWIEVKAAENKSFGGTWVVPEGTVEKDTLDSLLLANGYEGNVDLIGEHHLVRGEKIGVHFVRLSILVHDGSGLDWDIRTVQKLTDSYSQGNVPSNFMHDLSTLVTRAKSRRLLTR